LQYGVGWKNIFIISPTFQKGGNDMAQRPTLLFNRTISMSFDELKSIQKAKVEIQTK
jgi:hypothetical protein